MTATLRNGLLFAGLLALLGCQRNAHEGEYRVVTEESISDPVERTEDSPATLPSQAATEETRDADAPSGVPTTAISTPPSSASDAVPPTDDAPKTADSPPLDENPPSAPLPRPLAAIVPPERNQTEQAGPPKDNSAEIARMRAQLLGGTSGEGSDGPRKIKLLVPEKTFSPEGTEQALRVTFDDIDLLKVLNMEPVPPDVMDHLPEWLSALDGQRIILRGWMYPPGRQEGITRFMFVRDNGICCFGRDPKVYDKLGVTLRKGQNTKYIEGRPFDVIGTLTIDAEIIVGDEGASWMYHLDDAIVIDK